MWISRVRVNGGFLNGLDATFAPGLNVVIGPRGAGKTTLLELIRHALGVPLPASTRRDGSPAPIAATLGGGEVVVDIETDGERIRLVVDAEGNGRKPLPEAEPLILGQNELEGIAADPQSRLELIDVRARSVAPAWPTERLEADTRRIARMKEQVRITEDELSQRSELEREVQTLREQESAILQAGSSALNDLRGSLELAEAQLRAVRDEQGEVVRASMELDSIGALESELGSNLSTVHKYRSVAVQSTVETLRGSVKSYLAPIAAALSDARSSLFSAQAELTHRERSLMSEAAPLRAELDEREAGLGELTSRIGNLTRLLTRLEGVNQSLEETREALDELESRRNAALADRDDWQSRLFAERQAVAASISGQLDQHVVVVMDHLADTREFVETLQRLLRASSVQTNSTARLIAQSVLPRQLLEFAEQGDAAGLASATDMALDRAARVINHLQDPESLAALTTVHLDDLVDFQLRDGVTLKSVEELSAGQKCAVTLPIYLTDRERPLVLDQPEDHLDNAYLVSNVVTGMIQRRQAGVQTIVATHNANIPVLGGGDRVLVLQSDGVRGHIALSGRFSDAPIVEQITRLMEGGREAFEARASFYSRYGVES